MPLCKGQDGSPYVHSIDSRLQTGIAVSLIPKAKGGVISMTIARAIVIGLAMLGTSACATNFGSTQVQDFGRYTQLQKGVTDKRGVHELFGQPQDVNYLQSGESAWTYYRVTMTTNALTYVPFVGMLAGGSDTNTTIATFFFDTKELFDKTQTSQKSQYMNMWVGMATLIAKSDNEIGRVAEEMKKLGLPFDEKLAKEMQGTDEIIK